MDMRARHLQPLAAYDPQYDPLVAPQPRPRHATTRRPTGSAPPARRRRTTAPSRGDIDADVVIVGSGFTGLATALFLAREHGIRATVLEANQSIWGCTSRNGGQGQNASGRLYRSQWIERWGKEMALKLDAEIREGFETFKSLVAELPCDAQPGGHFYVAHRRSKMDFLRNEAKVMREVFGYDTRMLSAEELRREYCRRGRGLRRACSSPMASACIRSSCAYGYLRSGARARRQGASGQPGASAWKRATACTT